MKIYLIRHGEPHYPTDSLTPQGKLEAEALADYLGTLKIDRIFSSPMGRAKETASFTAAKTGLAASILDWTAELSIRNCDGSDYMAWDMNPENLRKPEYQDCESWHPALEKIANESDAWFEELGWKRNGFVYERMQESIVPKNIQLALFCHGGFGLTWLSHLLAIPKHYLWSGFFLQTSSVTTILFDERTESKATPRVISLSALPHVYKAGLTPSTAGIKANTE
ncbi:MAG: histidine phosphatase family protein [Verrucomicrobia bacterium]|nr:histidine phosphatase family protein [Verrucomicrobiota bacterium]MCH8513308.1 histidine phosphatase family protein [Kiritimatiellia bacterium]